MTSALNELLDRLIAHRLAWWMNYKEPISPWQAGLRKGRPTTGHTLRLTQNVFDGFQTKQSLASLIA